MEFSEPLSERYMKFVEVAIEKEWVLLGVFSTPTFRDFQHRLTPWGDFVHRYPDAANIMDTVEGAVADAEKIIFVLDDVSFPVNPEKSITCAELKLICDNDSYFAKTIFVKGDNVI